METTIVHRDNDSSIKFIGEEVASASSSADKIQSNYSGRTGRWEKLTLYRTKGGKFICERVDYTQWQGEETSYSGVICDNDKQVVDFFGYGRLANELYISAQIDASVVVE